MQERIDVLLQRALVYGSFSVGSDVSRKSGAAVRAMWTSVGTYLVNTNDGISRHL